ncbi:MAG: DUF4124 domain-containing protein [Deltaproteobacteria bacterium]|nr:DUF4124 domain-containing protein [Deltaproteobacteria bacterium]
MIRIMTRLWTLSFLLFAAAPALADVIEWRDAAGVRHYTNLKEEIPEEQRGQAQVVIDESVRHRAAEAEPPVATASVEPEARHMAQAVYDRPPVSDAYLDGLRQGIEMVRASNLPAAAPAVQINGPLAIANAVPPPSYVVPSYGYPFVTTSFDRGRSRHQTLRMLLQDEFALERDLTFGYPNDYFLPVVPPVVPSRFVPRRGGGAGLVRR